MPKLSTYSKPAGVFRTFPEFTKLTLADREVYEAQVADFPPLADLSFPALMFWWNSLNSCAVAHLNGNLIISYWLPGIEEYSGLSVIGHHKVEETICEIFDYQKAKGESPRLSHVPEFVLAQIRHPDLFVVKPERDLDEYIYNVANFYPVGGLGVSKRSEIQKFVKSAGTKEIETKSLDMSLPKNRTFILDHVEAWRKTGYLNDSVAMEIDAIHVAVAEHERLGIDNICVFVGGRLQAFFLYYAVHDRRYVVMTNARVNAELPYTGSYALYAFAEALANKGVEFMNFECDLGSTFMRSLKLSLGPSEFFRKYTIEPAS